MQRVEPHRFDCCFSSFGARESTSLMPIKVCKLRRVLGTYGFEPGGGGVFIVSFVLRITYGSSVFAVSSEEGPPQFNRRVGPARRTGRVSPNPVPTWN